jgi:aldose sugar dehydrogenase
VRSNSWRLGIVSPALLALVLAAACGGGGGGGYGSTPTTTPPTTQPAGAGVADLTIMIVGMKGDMSYSPNPAVVKVGQKVAWRNADSTTHAILEDDTGGNQSPYSAGFSTGDLAPGATSPPFTMRNAGTTGYHCGIHPTMVGTLTATQ